LSAEEPKKRPFLHHVGLFTGLWFLEELKFIASNSLFSSVLSLVSLATLLDSDVMPLDKADKSFLPNICSVLNRFLNQRKRIGYPCTTWGLHLLVQMPLFSFFFNTKLPERAAETVARLFAEFFKLISPQGHREPNHGYPWFLGVSLQLSIKMSIHIDIQTGISMQGHSTMDIRET